MAAEGAEAPLSQSRFSMRGAAPAAGTQQDGFSTPVSRRPSRSIASEAPGPSPRKPTTSRGSLIPRKGSTTGPQRDQIAGVTLCLLNSYQNNSCTDALAALSTMIPVLTGCHAVQRE